MTNTYYGPSDGDFMSTYGEDADFVPPIEGGKVTPLGLFFELEDECPVPHNKLADPRKRARFILRGLLAAGSVPQDNLSPITFADIDQG